MKTTLRLYQQRLVASVGIVAIILGTYGYFAAKAILAITAWVVAIVLMAYLTRHLKKE